MLYFTGLKEGERKSVRREEEEEEEARSMTKAYSGRALERESFRVPVNASKLWPSRQERGEEAFLGTRETREEEEEKADSQTAREQRSGGMWKKGKDGYSTAAKG